MSLIATPPASSTVGVARRAPPASSIVAIDRRRLALGLSHWQLCARAGVHPDTWKELRRQRRQPTFRTLRALQRALDDLETGEGVPRRTAATLFGFYRLIAQQVASSRGVAPADVVAALRDFAAEKPNSAAWLAIARVRRLAMYIVTVEFEIDNAALARAIGCSRQNIKQARDAVEDWRARDPEVAALIARIAALAEGAW